MCATYSIELYITCTKESLSIEPFHSKLWNKNENRSWRMDLGDISYGLGT